MNDRQFAALALLKAMPKRDIYEGAGPGGKIGSGSYWVTYSDGTPGPVLTRADVDDLIRRGRIEPRYPDKPELHCYRLRETQDE